MTEPSPAKGRSPHGDGHGPTPERTPQPVHRHAGARIVLICVGWLAIILGVIGVFLPLLPTTPFILLASWCFMRSSPRFHQWLLNHKQLGAIVDAFENNRRLPIPIRNRALLVSWLALLVSMWVVRTWWAYGLLTGIGLLLTLYLFRLSAREDSPRAEPEAMSEEVPRENSGP